MAASRGKIPRFPEAAGAVLSRSSILNGKVPVVMCPLLLTGGSPGQDAANAIGLYAPPTDWPAAGSLLRMPQVVWITNNFGGFMYPNLSGNSTLIGPAATAAAATINALRPGRTFVIDQVSPSCSLTGSFSAGWTAPQVAYTPTVPVPSVGSIPAIGSIPADAYVGCDFLNLHGCAVTYSCNIPGYGPGCTTWPDVLVDLGARDGDPPHYDQGYSADADRWSSGSGSADSAGGFGTSVTPAPDNHYSGIGPPYYQGAGWTGPISAALALLRKNYGRFSGYTCMMFKGDFTASDLALGTTNPGWMQVDRIQQLNTDAITSIAGSNGDLGFSVAGNLSSWVNSSYLVNLIASHYNFDPATGLDLPLS